MYKKLEENGQLSGNVPPVYVCFLGHSMGGLVGKCVRNIPHASMLPFLRLYSKPSAVRKQVSSPLSWQQKSNTTWPKSFEEHSKQNSNPGPFSSSWNYCSGRCCTISGKTSTKVSRRWYLGIRHTLLRPEPFHLHTSSL